MAEPIPEVHAISAALLDIEGAGQTSTSRRDTSATSPTGVSWPSSRWAAKVRFRTCDLDDFIAARVREADR